MSDGKLIVLAETVISVHEDPKSALTDLEADLLAVYDGGLAVIGYQAEGKGPDGDHVAKVPVPEVAEEYLRGWVANQPTTPTG